MSVRADQGWVGFYGSRPSLSPPLISRHHVTCHPRHTSETFGGGANEAVECNNWICILSSVTMEMMTSTGNYRPSIFGIKDPV